MLPAGITASGRLSLGDAYASLLFSNGLNVVLVSRQRGHANPSITLEVYAHLFAQSDHAADARGALDADSSSVLVSVGITPPPPMTRYRRDTLPFRCSSGRHRH